jgi:hypothetical protein
VAQADFNHYDLHGGGTVFDSTGSMQVIRPSVRSRLLAVRPRSGYTNQTGRAWVAIWRVSDQALMHREFFGPTDVGTTPGAPLWTLSTPVVMEAGADYVIVQTFNRDSGGTNQGYTWRTVYNYSDSDATHSHTVNGVTVEHRIGQNDEAGTNAYNGGFPTIPAHPANSPGAESNVMAYRIETYQAPTQPGAFTDPTAGEVHDATVAYAHGASTDPDGDAVTYDVESSSDNGGNWTLRVAGATGVSGSMSSAAWAASTTTKLRVRAKDPSGQASAWRESAAFTVQHNQAPTAPTGLTPSGGSIVDRTAAQVFGWTRNDPDAGDYQTKYELRYRLVGAGSWTTLAEVVSGTTSHTFAANFFAAGNYEWQVRLADQLGVWSPFSASAFFTAAVPPAAPGITAPVNGSTLASADGEVVWTAPDQSAFQARRVADAAGAADPNTVYYDSGTVVSAAARNHGLTFSVNNRWEHVQVRVRDSNNLWSTWSSVRVQVSYTPPAAPTLVASVTAAGHVAVVVTHPAPSGGQPAIATHDVYRRRVGDGSPEGVRVAAGVAPGATWVDALVGHRESYEYRAVAHGANGTSSTSAWTA